MPGKAKSTVHAFTGELDLWLTARLAGSPAPPEPKVVPSETPPASAPKGKYRASAILLAGAVAVSVLAITGLRLAPWGHAGAPAAMQAFRAGEYAWQKRTPAGLHRAVDAFTQAIVADPSFAPAYVGLADCYNLLPEFGNMAPAEAFPRAKAAAERAVALDPDSAAAHRSLGFALFWWGDDRNRALSEFRTALRLDPDSAQSHHWYANALAADLDPAAEGEITRAGELDPTSTAIKADAGWIAYMLGRFGEAITVLDEVVEVDPSYSTSFRYRAAAKREIGDYSGMLADLKQEAELRNDSALRAAVDAAAAALRADGPRAMFRSLAAGEETLFSHGGFPASRLAADEFIAGDRTRALELLAVTKQRREWFASAINNPAFGKARNELDFTRLQGS